MRYIKSIKFRLAVWYLAILVILLFIFATVAYIMLSYSLYQNLDDSLILGATQAKNSLEMEDESIAPQHNEQSIFGERPVDFMLMYDDHGHLIQSLGQSVDIPQIKALQEQSLAGQSFFVTSRTTNRREYRLYTSPLRNDSAVNGVVVVGSSTHEIKEVLGKLRVSLIFTVLATIALAAGGGLFLANRAFKPVEQIARTAREIEGSDLSRRIEISSEDELGRLADTLNQMIARLERAFSRQRQFTADASHELRTPLSVIQAESTLSLRKERKEGDYRKSLELISREAAQMSNLIDKLLFLARSECDKEKLRFETVNLESLITELNSETEVLCREKRLQFKVNLLEHLDVKGDKVELKQLFSNLFDNAIRYTPTGGTITVSLVRKGETAVATITDSGVGIPKEHLSSIFERFYRVDKARSQAEGGAGLGLSICQHVAQIHGGSIEVESEVGKGSTFSIFLPLFNKS